jgi:hypothetical protein
MANLRSDRETKLIQPSEPKMAWEVFLEISTGKELKSYAQFPKFSLAQM